MMLTPQYGEFTHGKVAPVGDANLAGVGGFGWGLRQKS
jgi:hypothetical protein